MSLPFLQYKVRYTLDGSLSPVSNRQVDKTNFLCYHIKKPLHAVGFFMTKIMSGKIKIQEPNGEVSPYENFIITVNPDQTKTLRTVTRSPKGDLLRDVNQLVGRDWRDIEAMGRLFYKGLSMGTVLRRVVGNRLFSTVWTRDGQADTAEFNAPKGLVLGFHPILHDAWKMNFLKTSHKREQKVLVHTVSTTWNGRTLSHGEQLESSVRYDGVETLDLQVGQLKCEKFIWHTSFGKVLCIWRTGEANILAKLSVLEGDNAGTNYELSQYSEEVIQTL
ncbi:MAG: hypothetical protein CMM25_05780 [Rhodospirillaceae bacterium]|nr:hypothetical protein [Rhodospirillaceae bacterium]